LVYAKSLRAIGQSLEIVHVEAFELDKKGDSYVVRSNSLTPTALWILRNSVIEKIGDAPGSNPKNTPLTEGDGWRRYDAFDISRLDAQGRKKRRGHSFAQVREAPKVSNLLRTLGEHLDIMDVSTFNISWTPDFIAVDYQTADGQQERKHFSAEKLRQLGLHMRFRRSTREK
jgi:hypothetical protein